MIFFIFFAISQSIHNLETNTPASAAIPISVSIDQMVHQSGECIIEKECTADQNTPPDCGKRCQASEPGHYFQYKFTGQQFQIYGSINSEFGQIRIHLPNNGVETIDVSQGNAKTNTLLYTSPVYDYGTYTIKVDNGNTNNKYEIYKFAYWPSIKAVRINLTDEQFGGAGNWQRRSDGIGGMVGWTNNFDDTAVSTIYCSRVWVYGAKDPGNGQIHILFSRDSKIIYDASVSENADQRIEGCLLYDSGEQNFAPYYLRITNPNRNDPMYISLSYVFYEFDPPTRSPAPNPSPTLEPLTQDAFINKKYEDYIPCGFPFIDVGVNTEITEITGCTFKNIVSEGFFIGSKIGRQIKFSNNVFEYSDGIVNPSIAFFGLVSKITIDHCTFTKFRYLKQAGEGLIFSFNQETEITFESCEFNNNGRSEEHAFFKINGEGSTFTANNCVFYNDENNEGSKVCNFKTARVNFNECTFTRPARDMIRITHNWLVNGQFKFTNNIVQNGKRQFIMAQQMRSEPVIQNNVFQNIDMISGYLISFINQLSKIELINNTFSSITTRTDSSYCGGISSWYQNSKNNKITVKYDNCKFYDITNNNVKSPYNQGGAMHYGYTTSISNAAVELLYCEFKRNNCPNGMGGAVSFSIDHDLKIDHCVFENNNAGSQGGAIYFWSKIEKPSNNPNAPNFDGTIKIKAISITNCEFTGNKASNGHAIYIQEHFSLLNAKLNVQSCQFTNNGDDSNNFLIAAYIGEIHLDDNHVIYNDITKSTGILYVAPEQAKLIEITNSEFENCYTNQFNAIYIDTKIADSTIRFLNCLYKNCISENYVIKVTKGNVEMESCTFTYDNNEVSCGSIDSGEQGLKVSYSNFIRTKSEGAIKVAQKHDAEEAISIVNTVFDDCVGTNTRCFQICFYTTDFTFRNNVFQNLKESGNNGYFLRLDCNFVLSATVFENITFQNNRCNSDYGGGSGIWITNTPTIQFSNCHFINNVAMRSPNGRDKYPTEPIERVYYSGDGGAIQYGFSDTIYNVTMEFVGCVFRNNGAVRHGGALALQTVRDVIISGCTFEDNHANYDIAVQRSAELLDYKNYYSLKTYGRGGAIYLNPAFNHESSDKSLHMLSVSIENNQFIDNDAYDGYAVYIQGDDPQIPIRITGNTFTNNFKERSNENLREKSIIFTEIKNIDTSSNTFDYPNGLAEIPIEVGEGDPEDTEDDGPDNFEIENVTTHGRHEHIAQDNSMLIVSIQVSHFSNIRAGNSHGGALYIVNAGLACQDISFLNCSTDEYGGAIFYHNEFNTTNYVNIIRNNITECSAKVGGGLYIYSSNRNNLVTVRFCLLERNSGSATKDQEFYGGSGIFVACRNGRIKQNILIDNIGDGSALKFYNKYESVLARKLSIDDDVAPVDKFVISNNKFVVLGSDSAVSYTRGNGGTLVVLSDCSFEGDLNKDAHFIDGETISSDSPKMIVKNCKFDGSKSKAFPLDSDFLSFVRNIDNNGGEKSEKKKLNNDSSKLALIVIVAAAAASVVSIIGFFIFKVRKSNPNENEMSSDVNDI